MPVVYTNSGDLKSNEKNLWCSGSEVGAPAAVSAWPEPGKYFDNHPYSCQYSSNEAKGIMPYFIDPNRQVMRLEQARY